MEIDDEESQEDDDSDSEGAQEMKRRLESQIEDVGGLDSYKKAGPKAVDRRPLADEFNSLAPPVQGEQYSSDEDQDHSAAQPQLEDLEEPQPLTRTEKRKRNKLDPAQFYKNLAVEQFI
mmetsp:Transcript_4691/g.7534  ORF Transcript_4691/g.7534 Transcript_4691/m.7534 type:complete len:119 (+) Transcript_4691:368-724(+)|eukprot:CAMPEP_0184307476 /NCGR_PEP_ID=MMETSP1049-20130417/16217_1 /TAXON_ID=77928 /ORGANISM="Proteomonas sulcata, Strain CCMP704" /LENGTH=118 /DNA_ID=CAMNT_0026619983 /DNA_START=316 /DNA_END=672 /DNA_ORIENTATION=-